MAFVTLSSKGQLVIPAPERRALGLKAGSRLQLRIEGEKLVLEPEATARRYRLETHPISGLPCMTPIQPAPVLTSDSVAQTLEEIGLA